MRGNGRFADDPRLPNQAYAVFVRSPHAHARIKSVNTDDALRAKGVLAVITAADLKAMNIGSISRHPPVPGRGGAKMAMPFRPALAGDKVMHGGDPVAMVVAETTALAQDAADLVQVDYEELPAVVDLDTAMNGKTQLYADAPGNLCIDWPGPVPSEDNERDVAAIIAKAAHVAKVSVTNQRMVVASMETRGATGVYDKTADSYTLHACSQGADSLRDQAASIMGVPNEKLRVITEDVGGAFGMKTPVYPEYIAVLVGAKKLGRPVHWSRRARKPSSPTRRRATPSPMSNSPATTRASSSRCACVICATRAPMSRPPASASTPTISRAACPACTRSARSMSSRRLLFLQHDRRSAPIAAPDARRRTTRSNARSRKPRAC